MSNVGRHVKEEASTAKVGVRVQRGDDRQTEPAEVTFALRANHVVAAFPFLERKKRNSKSIQKIN